MNREPVPNPINNPDAPIPIGRPACFAGNHRNICGARATRIQARPIPANTLVSKIDSKLLSIHGRIPKPRAMKNPPIDIDSFGPFLSISAPAGQAKKITNIPIRESKRCASQSGMRKFVSKVFNIGDNANQFAPYAKITNQNIPTVTQRYRYSFCSIEYLSGPMIPMMFL